MKRIMIVDDEILVRVGMRSILNWEENGYTIVGEAENGKEALEKIERSSPDIIFTDLYMEGMDGFALMERCIKKYPGIKFIVLSSYNDFDNVRRAMKLGAVDYIFKLTSKPAELLKMLEECSKMIDSEKNEQADSSADVDSMVWKNITSIKSGLFKKLIQQNYMDTEALQQEFSALHLKTDFIKPNVLIYLSIVDYDSLWEGGSQPGNTLLKFSLENMVIEIMNKNLDAETYDYDGGDLILTVVFPVDMDYRDFCELIRESFHTISVYAKRYLGIEISACVGVPCHDIRNLGGQVNQMKKRLHHLLGNEKGKIYFFDNGTREEIQSVKQYIWNHLQEELSVSQLAKYINMSESYFSHVFKKEVGHSFTSYVNQTRVEKAKMLLANSELKVNEVAEIVGLYNPNYFSTLFKKATGKSPNQFRSDMVQAQ